LEFIEFDGEIFWKIDDEIELWETEIPNILPSNCRLRADYKNLKENNIQRADMYLFFFGLFVNLVNLFI